jgi:hypothetical protein
LVQPQRPRARANGAAATSQLQQRLSPTDRDQLEPTIQPAKSNQSQSIILFGPISLSTCLMKTPCCLLASKLCFQSPSHGDNMATWRVTTLSFPPTLLQASLGGEGVPLPTARPSSQQSTRP